LTLFMRFVV